MISRLIFVSLYALLICQTPASAVGGEIEAVTFAVVPEKTYVPLEEAARRLGWRIKRDEDSKRLTLRKVLLPRKSIRRLIDGTEWIAISDLEARGAKATTDPEKGTVAISSGFARLKVAVGAKRAEINLAKQQLSAWQGNRLVLRTRISSGKRGRTPTGKFEAGPYKARRHYSSRYNNASMPWSVQVHGHIFVHGFTSVPNYPASHGCVRVPLTEGNPAKFFYEWIDRGTPIHIVKK
jgi:lipoprotein-anchoring transpeptidase ErfK/SrfK